MATGTLSALIAGYKRERLEKVGPLVYAEECSRVTTRSPVDRGYFRANWSASIGASEARALDTSAGAPLPARTDVAGVANRARIGDAMYFVNGASYGPRLEYVGWSKQAPQGFLRVTMAEHQQITNAVVSSLR